MEFRIDTLTEKDWSEVYYILRVGVKRCRTIYDELETPKSQLPSTTKMLEVLAKLEKFYGLNL